MFKQVFHFSNSESCSFFVIMITLPSFAIEDAPRILDREIIESLAELKAQQKAEQKAEQKVLEARFSAEFLAWLGLSYGIAKI